MSTSTALVVKGADGFAFGRACQAFEALAKVEVGAPRGTRPKIMQKLFEAYGYPPASLYPLLRLVLPHLDNTRPNYNMKQAQLAKAYVGMLGLSATSEHARQMTEWKRPKSGLQQKDTGNFPEVMYSVLVERVQTRASLDAKGKAPLTVSGLNGLLDDLARASGLGEKERVLKTIYDQTTAVEQKWILRIVLKDMAIGMKEDSVFRLLHPDAQELYNSVCSLEDTCTQVADPTFSLDATGEAIALFQPLKPRLAHREPWQAIDRVMKKHGGPYGAELKHDGERLLLHWERGKGGQPSKAEWWTRKAKQFNSEYKESMEEVLGRCFPASTTSLLLDGEMMVWDQQVGRYSLFGENRSMKDYKKRVESGCNSCYIVFDCLWLNGENLSGLPLSERRRRLEGAVLWEPDKHTIMLNELTEIDDGKVGVMRALDDALARGTEGVVFKSLGSKYEPGQRTTEWIKLKPDHIDGMGEQLDLLIIGSYYGEGKRRGGDVSHFLLGVLAPEYEETRYGKTAHYKGTKLPLVYPFCKVGSGYSLPTLAKIREELKRDGAEHPYDKVKGSPAHMCGWKPNKTDDIPDFWYEPQKIGFLLQVKAYEITTDAKGFMPCDKTLRFPRVEATRWDKDWRGCETHDGIVTLYKQSAGKVAQAKRSAEDIARNDDGSGGKKKKGGGGGGSAPQRGPAKVPAHFRVAGKGVTAESDAFAGMRAVVLSGRDSDARERMVIAIKRLGGVVQASIIAPPKGHNEFGGAGTAVETSGSKKKEVEKPTTHVFDPDEEPGMSVKAQLKQAESAAKKGEELPYDLVKGEWVTACAEANEGRGARLPLEPRYERKFTEATKAIVGETMDEFGDRYAAAADLDSLEAAMRLSRKLRPPPAAGEEGDGGEAAVAAKLRRLDDASATALRTQYSALRGAVAYAPSAAARLRLRLRGARVLDAPAADATHAVLPDGADVRAAAAAARTAFREAMLRDEEAEEAGEEGGGGARPFHKRIVTEGWLAACEEAGAWVDERPYEVHELS